MLLGAAVLTLRYWVLPGIGQYREDVLTRVSAATGMRMEAETMEGDWQGLRPALSFRKVRLTSPGAEETGLSLDALQASLSWWSLLLGEIRFHEVVLEGPSLTLKRGKDGLIRFNGRPLNKQSDEPSGDVIPWLLQQPLLEVADARLEWHDDLTDAPPLVFRHLDLRVQKSGTRHRIAMIARPDEALARRLEARALLSITRPDDRWSVDGTVYVALEQGRLEEFRRHFPMPDAVRTATGNARVWLELDDKAPRKVKAITVDLNAVNVSAQWSVDTAPLQLTTLAGRTEWETVPGGFQVSSKGLQLRTRDGVTVTPMDFSLMLAEPVGEGKRGSLSGSGVDLRVMAALLNYFPVGREVRERVAAVAPRGRIQSAEVSWTGPIEEPRSYRIKAAVDKLSMEASETFPGVQALTGQVEGTEKGGRLTLDSPGLGLDMPQVFRAPLKFDQARAVVRWNRETAGAPRSPMSLEIASLALENPDFAMELSGSYRTGGKGPGLADFTAQFARAEAGRVANYLPNSAPYTRSWLDRAIPTGKVTAGKVVLKGDLYDFPFAKGEGGQFLVDATVQDTRLRFKEDWPLIDNIRAQFRLENTRVLVNAESASIFQSRVTPTRVEIDNTRAEMPMLMLKGGAIASAQDTARYLRESPLREGPGRVTRVLGFEGPGKLELSLAIPLERAYADGRPAPFPKVSGTYTFNGVTVKPVLGQPVTELAGALLFTEQGITGRDLKGTAFGNPLTLGLSTDPAKGITALLAGRADVRAVNDYLPFVLPAQVFGSADFKGQVLVHDGVVDMQFTSSLAGVTSRLPRPLAKRETDGMDITVDLRQVGTANERIDIGLSNVLYGVIQRRPAQDGNMRLAGGIFSVGEAIGSRAIPEGLWLIGKAAEFDVDQWRTIVAGTPAAPGSEPAKADSPSAWTGFDLKADRLTVYGRDIAQAAIKGRRTAEDWRLTIESKEVTGDASWKPSAAEGRGLVRARLSNFVLNREAQRNLLPGESTAMRVEPPEVEYPALDISADSFTFHGYTMGKLALRAEHIGRDWKIDQLKIEADGATLDAAGRWVREGGSRSEFQGKLDVKNLNGLLRIFGHADAIKRGTGSAEATLNWPGSPVDFAFTRLSGDIKLEARRGEFAKIEPGAGRLLGLISLQSIPRRITLDFRDLFSDGFAFDRMGGNFKIERGVMRTSNYEIAGPSAFVTMQGEISLVNETQNLKLTVIPALGESVSIIGTLLGGPVVGLTTLLAQKLLSDPVGRAFGFEYNVTGKWDNPDVARVGAPPANNPTPNNATPAPATPGKNSDKP